MELRNKDAKIIIISGKARNGKDTVMSYLRDNYENIGKKVINLQYSTYIKDFKPIIDDKNFIAGLICDNGILLRNEVQSKNISKNNNQDYGLEM